MLLNKAKNLKISIKGEAVGSFAFGVKKGSKYEYLVTEFNEALAQNEKKIGSLEKIITKWTSSTATKTTSSTPETTTPAGTKSYSRKINIYHCE